MRKRDGERERVREREMERERERERERWRERERERERETEREGDSMYFQSITYLNHSIIHRERKICTYRILFLNTAIN